MDIFIKWIFENYETILLAWVGFFLIGTLVLYIGFGFAMAALRSHKEKRTAPIVLVVDVIISLFFLVLDVLLNIIVYPFICLDFRPKYTITTISHRMSRYNQDSEEIAYRRIIASAFDAFLDGKDPSTDHITGPRAYFKWLGQ
jgi:hypothetical protein